MGILSSIVNVIRSRSCVTGQRRWRFVYLNLMICALFIPVSVAFGSGAQPDLIVDSVASVNPSTAIVGDPIEVSIAIKNIGNSLAEVTGSKIGIYTDVSFPPGYLMDPDYEFFFPSI